jgi:SulP family sulfate permease
MAFFTDQMKELLCPLPDLSKCDGMGNIDEEQKREPIVLIMDCTLVLGIDSSAARAIVKLKDTILKEYKIQLCIFVSGSIEGFPTEFDLRDKLSTERDVFDSNPPSEDTSLLAKQIKDEEDQNMSKYTGSCVRDSLDLALMEAEDALIAKQNPSLLEEDDLLTQFTFNVQSDALSSTEEKEEFISSFKVICPINISDEEVNLLFLSFEREVFQEGDLIWKQNDQSDCVKLLILGQLIAELENEAGTKEIVPKGSIIGELGLVNGDPRMSTVKCSSKDAVLYSMNREKFEKLVVQQPKLARYIDLICVKYLTLRVQHVSNRIFETRCLPI